MTMPEAGYTWTTPFGILGRGVSTIRLGSQITSIVIKGHVFNTRWVMLRPEAVVVNCVTVIGPLEG